MADPQRTGLVSVAWKFCSLFPTVVIGSQLRSFKASVTQVALQEMKRKNVNPVIYRSCPQMQGLLKHRFGLSRTWKESPLITACKLGSWSVAEKIAEESPDFARAANLERSTALHLASAAGQRGVVAALVKQNPKLCLVTDRSSMIPLQIAVINGHGDVIRALIAARPDSIGRKTHKNKETLFHLAVKNGKIEAFAALLEEAKSQNQEHLVHQKDRQGDNVLHIATSNNQAEIVRLLLPASKSSVRVNSLNRRRHTALDLCYQNPWDRTRREISDILRDNGGVNEGSLPQRARLRWTMETKNVILVVLGVVSGAVFTAVCNLPDPFQKHHCHCNGSIFHVRDVLTGHVPAILYLMVFNTAILVACMVAILVLLWSLQFRPVLLFVTLCIVVVYGILMYGVMPKFVVKFGNHNIASPCVVWVLVGALICSAGIAYYMLGCAGSCLCRFGNWVIREMRDGNFLTTANMMH